MRPACRRGGVAGRCTAWRRHEPAPPSFLAARRCCSPARGAAGARRRHARFERHVPLPGQRLQEHDHGQGSGEARLQADRGRAGHDHPDDQAARRRRRPCRRPAAAASASTRSPSAPATATRAASSRASCKTEEEKLAVMQKEFNNGQPERQGDEKNFQKYLDRVDEMRAAIARKQTDIAALQREIKKLPPPLPRDRAGIASAAGARPARRPRRPPSTCWRRWSPWSRPKASASSSTRRSRPCSACRGAACRAAWSSTGSSIRRCCATPSPRSATTPSRPAGSRRS